MSTARSTTRNFKLLSRWPQTFMKPTPQVSLLITLLSKTTATVFKASVLKSLAILQIKLGTTWNRLKMSAHLRYPATKSVRLSLFTLGVWNWKDYARHGASWTMLGQAFRTSTSQAWMNHDGSSKQSHIDMHKTQRHRKSPAKIVNKSLCSLEARGNANGKGAPWT